MNRRDFTRAALAALPASALLAKPNSKFGGVQIGAITYCFRSLPSTATDLLKYCTELGISSVELMGEAAEGYAGAPPSRPGAFGGGRRQMTPEQQEAMKKAAAERKSWRLSVSVD